MQDKAIADVGRKYNTMKNKALAVELRKFLDGDVKDSETNRIAFQKLLGVVIGRLNTL